jgi:hypothetical protein
MFVPDSSRRGSLCQKPRSLQGDLRIYGAIHCDLTTGSLAAILSAVNIVAFNLVAEDLAHGTGESSRIYGAIHCDLTTGSLAAILSAVKIVAFNLVAEDLAHGTGESSRGVGGWGDSGCALRQSVREAWFSVRGR